MVLGHPKKLLLINFLIFFIFSCACNQSDKVITYKTGNNFWAYKIKFKNKIFIKQEHIPSINGNKYFKTEKDAEKLGTLVLSKLLKNPNDFPDVSLNELDSLNIEY